MPQLNAKFYSYSKRTNSTKRPLVTTEGVQLPITINDNNSSILYPHIRLQYVAAEPYQYNYVHIPVFRRFYYISDWVFNGDGTWTAVCTVDALASWRDEIYASGGMIDRAQTYNQVPAYDPRIPDNKYPAILDSKQYIIGFNSSPLAYQFSQGSFVLGCITTPSNSDGEPTTDATTVGSATYYIITAAEMARLIFTMRATRMTDQEWSNIGLDWVQQLDFLGVLNSWAEMNKTAINPLQYIVSAKWFPFQITSSNALEYITLGGWSTRAQGRRLSSTSQHIGPVQSIPLNTLPVGMSLDPKLYPLYEPYATYSLRTPWGVFDLDSNMMAELILDTRAITYDYYVDLISGRAVFVVQGTPGGFQYLIMRRDVDLALDIPLTQITFDKMGQISNWVSLGTRMLNDLPAGAVKGIQSMGTDTRIMGQAVRDTTTDLQKIISNRPSAVSTTTTAAAFTSDLIHMEIVVTRYRITEPNPELFGAALKRNVTSLQDYSGYVQMDGTTFSANCTDTERDEILQYMLGGFYLE